MEKPKVNPELTRRLKEVKSKKQKQLEREDRIHTYIMLFFLFAILLLWLAASLK